MKIFCSLWPLLKKHKISLYNFQMCLMARLKALGILRWNLGSDIEIHDLRSSAMVLIDVFSVATGDVAEDVRLKMENGWYVGLNTPIGPYRNHIRKFFTRGIGHKGHFCGL